MRFVGRILCFFFGCWEDDTGTCINCGAERYSSNFEFEPLWRRYR